MAVTGQVSLFTWLKAERKTSRVLTSPKVLVDILGHQAALMLSQMLYWGDRAKDRDGWFYKTRKQWQEELSLSEWHVRCALSLLSDAGVVQSKIVALPHGRATAFRVEPMQLAALLEGAPCGRGVMRNPHDPSGESLTTHHEAPSRPPTPIPYMYLDDIIDVRARAEAREESDQGQHPIQQQRQQHPAKPIEPSSPIPEENEVNQFGGKTRKDLTISTSLQVMNTLKKQQAADDAPTRHVNASTLGRLWSKWAHKYNPDTIKCMPVLTQGDIGRLKRPVIVWKAGHQDPNAVLKAVLRDWSGYCKFVQEMQNLSQAPYAPSIGFMVKYCNEALNFYMRSGEKKLEVLVAMKEPAPVAAPIKTIQKNVKQAAEKIESIETVEAYMAELDKAETLEEFYALQKKLGIGT